MFLDRRLKAGEISLHLSYMKVWLWTPEKAVFSLRAQRHEIYRVKIFRPPHLRVSLILVSSFES
jgi:hypothetical protein